MELEKSTLSKSALGSFGSAIMGIGCTAPAFSIAVTSATIVGDVGTFAVGSIILCGLIMFGLVATFANLNRILPSAGASYAWVSAIFGSFAGFITGWSMLLASVIFMVAASIPAASATLLIIAPEYVSNLFITSIVAIAWLTLISLIVIRGVKNAYILQLLMTAIEVMIIIALAIGTLKYFYHQPAHHVNLDWIFPVDFSPRTFAAGAITALFFYWGWDVTMTLGEETRDGEAGKGAFFAVANLMLLFSIMISIILIALTDREIEESSSNVLFALANKIFPHPWGYAAILCTMLSTIGTIEGQIIQFSRCVFAMARDGALPGRLSLVHMKWKTPWAATMLIWLLGTAFIITSASLPSVNEILKSAIAAIGIQICLYMTLAGLASIWHYRYMFGSGIYNSCRFILVPSIGTLGILTVGILSIPQLSRVSLIVGIGGILIGAIFYGLTRRS